MNQTTDEDLKQILSSSKRIAVIGLSPVPARPSYGVTRYMIESGYEIFGIRPGSPATILGRPAFERLSDLKEDVDILNVFRNPEALPALIDEIEVWMKTRDKKPSTLWLQEGVTHPEAEAKAQTLGLKVVANRCILKDHARLS